MKNHNRHAKNLLAVITVVVSVMASVAACSDSNQTAGQKVDAAVASTERKADEIKAEIKQGAAEMKDVAGQATASAKLMASDATITSTVNIALAKDASLSALKIDVDTRAGRVVLNGTAPDDAARARATKLVEGVSGVTAVDNRLTVR